LRKRDGIDAGDQNLVHLDTSLHISVRERSAGTLAM